MINDSSADAEILSQEQAAIDALALNTHTPVEKVQEIFLIEFKKLAENAHVTSYLPLLASNSVRVILDAQNAQNDSDP